MHMIMKRKPRVHRGTLASLVAVFLLAACSSAGSGPASDGQASTPRTGPGTKPIPATTATTVTATEPSPAPVPPTSAAPVDAMLQQMTEREKVCQLFVVLGYGANATSASPAQRAVNQAYLGAPTIADAIGQCPVGGLIYLARNTLDPAHEAVATDNLRDPAQISSLSDSAQTAATSTAHGIPLLIAADQEEGLVTRIRDPLTTFSGNMALGADGNPDDAERASRASAEEIRALGINTNFAPVADVNINPSNPVIGVRSFGADPQAVAQLTAASVRGLQSSGVAATAKHFPGHGDTSVDSHFGLPVIAHDRDTFEATDLPPFRAAIAANTDLVMVGHIAAPRLDPSGTPATLSAPIVTGVLRQELGYDGVVVTDSLWMQPVRAKYSDGEVAVQALQAGDDLLLSPPNLSASVDSILAAVHDGRLDQSRIDQSVRRILVLKSKLGLLSGPPSASADADRFVGRPANRELANHIALNSATVVEANCRTFPLTKDRGAVVVGSDASATGQLAGDLRDRGFSVTALGGGSGQSAIVGAAQKAGAAIVVAHEVHAGDDQQALVAALVARGVPTLVVGTGAPYDAGVLPSVDGYVAVYDPGPAAMLAAAQVLSGQAEGGGHLPAAVPAAGGPGFPLGTGLGPCP